MGIVFSTLSFLLAAAAAGQVNLAWDSSNDPSVVGYHVYRSRNPHTGYVRVNRSLLETSSFLDHPPDDAVYYYVVTAVNQQGVESAPSDWVRFETPPSPESLVFPVSFRWDFHFFADAVVGVNLFNPEQEATGVGFTATGPAGEQLAKGEVNRTLPPLGQQGLRPDDLIPPNLEAVALKVFGKLGPLHGALALADGQNTRLDAVSGRRSRSSLLYFPLVRRNQAGSTLLFLFNPNERNDRSVRLRLFDSQGGLVREKSHSILASSPLAGNLKDLLGVENISQGFVKVSSALDLEGFSFDADSRSYASLPALPAPPRSQLLVPYYCFDAAGTSTELGLLNLASASVRAEVQLVDGSSLRSQTRTLELKERSLWLQDFPTLLGSDPSQRSLQWGYAFIRFSRPVPVLGFVTYRLEGGKSRSSLPLTSEGLQDQRLFSIAQSGRSGMFTGLAVLNPWPAEVALTLEAWNRNGLKTGERAFRIAPQGQVVDLLNGERFLGKAFEQVGGHLRLRSSRPVLSFALVGDHLLTFLLAVESQPTAPDRIR